MKKDEGIKDINKLIDRLLEKAKKWEAEKDSLDYNITRKWEMADGGAITGLSDEVQIWDVGDTFNIAHNSGATIPTWLIYEGYRLSMDAPGDPLHSGMPSYTVNVTDKDVTVTYVYRATTL